MILIQDYSCCMYVCICKAVNERQIERAVASGVRNIKGLCRATAAGTCCGKCLPEAKRCLDQHLQQSTAVNALAGLGRVA